MSITTKTGATNSTTGGTSVSYVRQSSQGNNTLYIEDGAEFTSRKKLTVKVSGGTVNSGAPGGFAHKRVVVTFAVPRVLADGETIDYDTLQVSSSSNVETMIAEIKADLQELVSALVTGNNLETIIAESIQPD